MEILLNGVTHAVPEGDSVDDLVGRLELTHKSIAVAVNRQVITRQNWASRVLQPNDKVDVVRAIGGG